MPMKRRKWLYAVLIVLTVVNIGVFVIVWQSGTSPGRSASSWRSMPRFTQSAAEAATVLQTWLAENGPADGAVVACTLTLNHSVTKGNWTFQVYSAKEGRLLVTVVHEQEVQVLRNIAALYGPTAVLPTTAWKQDIDTVMKTWWREGGSTAWNTASPSTLTVRLGMREDGIPSWQLTLVKDKENVLEYWEIYADTGVLLEHSATGGP
jgi:hypothetical protein